VCANGVVCICLVAQVWPNKINRKICYCQNDALTSAEEFLRAEDTTLLQQLLVQL